MASNPERVVESECHGKDDERGWRSSLRKFTSEQVEIIPLSHRLVVVTAPDSFKLANEQLEVFRDYFES